MAPLPTPTTSIEPAAAGSALVLLLAACGCVAFFLFCLYLGIDMNRVKGAGKLAGRIVLGAVPADHPKHFKKLEAFRTAIFGLLGPVVVYVQASALLNAKQTNVIVGLAGLLAAATGTGVLVRALCSAVAALFYPPPTHEHEE